MKKKILALLLTAILCLSLAVPCFAASKPAIEIVRTTFDTNSVGGVSPTIYYCNNSGKVIKYITWYMTPYNAVNDAVTCSVRGKSQVIGKTTGPINPMEIRVDKSRPLSTNKRLSSDSPFAVHRSTSYCINTGFKNALTTWEFVDADKFGNFFVEIYTWSGNYTYIYLTDDEVQNYMYDYNISMFENAWYNGSIRSFRVNKAVVEFMDGSKQTISENQLYGTKYNHTLQNKPFSDAVSQYSAVYNYKDYVQYNPDLATVFGDNQKALFEHFINSGMKEGRQGSSKFNLAAYKANNPDLVALFGDDNAKYYEHYMAGGKAEGRVAV